MIDLARSEFFCVIPKVRGGGGIAVLTFDEFLHDIVSQNDKIDLTPFLVADIA